MGGKKHQFSRLQCSEQQDGDGHGRPETTWKKKQRSECTEQPVRMVETGEGGVVRGEGGG